MTGLFPEHHPSAEKPKRDPLDRYYTPRALARDLVATLPDCIRDGVVIEPSVGGGAFADALRDRGAFVVGVDVDPNAAGFRGPYDEVADFLRWTYDEPRDVSWVVGNPAYCDAEKHVVRALGMARVGVAMLLRLAFTEAQERVAFWRRWGPHLDSVRVLAARPSFTGGGTDTCAYGWFVWRTDRLGAQRVIPCWTPDDGQADLFA